MFLIQKKVYYLNNLFEKTYAFGKSSFEKTISRQVLPHAPSPTTTNFFRIEAVAILFIS